MTDKAKEGQKDGGCCGGATKSVANDACCTDKTAQAPQAEKKAEKGGCGCA